VRAYEGLCKDYRDGLAGRRGLAGALFLGAVAFLAADCGSPSNRSAIRGSGGATGTSGVVGTTGTGGASSTGGRAGISGATATDMGGARSGSGGTGGAIPTGGIAAGGGSGAGGSTRTGGTTSTRDAGPSTDDASSDSRVVTGGARTGGATGTGTGGKGTDGAATGGTGANRDGGLSTGGITGGGGATAAGGAATGGSTGAPPACVTNEASHCTSGTGPLGAEIRCDFGGSDGDYDLTVEVGGDAASETFVDAEMYRRMLPQRSTIAGQPQRFSFAVNVRTPEGQPLQVGTTDSVPGLQIYFRGPNPKVNAICHQTASKPLMLWIGGDSTVCDQDSTNYTGWGQRLPQLMQGPVSIANYADSGESSGSFLASSAMFKAIKSRWKTDDWFFVQMGHNDKTTDAATFQSNMASYVTQAKAAGVNIVLITPISRVGYTLAEEHVNSTGANLPQIIRDLGKSENVPVIDLTVTTWNWIQSITPKDYFAADSAASGGYDHTHLGPKGGDAVAGFVRDAIKASPGIPALVHYLR
jgi:lysophospholipase L1-like esterase